MKTKILIGLIAILGVLLVYAVYENLSLKDEVKELSKKQEISSQKINQQNSVISYLIQNSNSTIENNGVPVLDMAVDFELSEPYYGVPNIEVPQIQEISYSTPALDGAFSKFAYTHAFDNYDAQVSFDYPSAFEYEVNPNKSWFQIFIVGKPDYPSFNINTDPKSCHYGYCLAEKISTFKTAHHEWNYLGYIKAGDIGVPSDELIEHYVFSIKIGDVVIYMESESDPREISNYSAYTIFDSFNFDIK